MARQKDNSERLIEALLQMNDDAACDLAARMSECGIRWNGRFRCKQPPCWRCRKAYQARQARLLIDELRGLDNQDLAFLSVVHAGTDDLGNLDALVAGLSRGARNCLDALRREDLDRWGGTAMRCWTEIDALAPSDLPLIGSERRALLPQIAPLVIDRPDPVWLIGCHGIVALGDASHAEVSDAMARQWPLGNQVDLRELDASKTVEENVENIVSYSTKFTCTTTLGAIREPWPHPWQAEIFSKLSQKRSAFEFLRFGVGPATVLQSCQDGSASSDDVLDPLPFAHASIAFPVSYITGRSGE